MVFFNYSTMQMAAKIVYYGPGLCGKTTNLQQIYNHTANDSRGEMVSLETETDRTLFFDLLPIDVGTIGGFSTRIQLYTVPGQVFYNTTRKLVLKGVDGVVFVADSQKPMLQANIDSLKNLEENLAEMGVELKSLPMVLQFNKRDLPSICTADEINEVLNWHDWPFFEASAINGQGVFETLKGISKLTLLALKRRLARNTEQSGIARTTPPPQPIPKQEAPATKKETAKSPSASASSPSASKVSSPAKASRPPSTPPVSAPPAATRGPAVRETSGAKRKSKTGLDVLGELEKLRREVQRPAKPLARADKNGHGELKREIQLSVNRSDFSKLRRFSLNLQVEDEENRIIDAVKDFTVDIKDPEHLDKVQLTLSIALNSKG